MKSVSVTVRGQVQGVGFRWFTRDAADAAGVTGWVRNHPDGSVEAMLCGDPDAVEAVLDAMRQGPPYAQVVEIETMPMPEPFVPVAGFEIRPNA